MTRGPARVPGSPRRAPPRPLPGAPPELASGLCVGHPAPRIWASNRPGERAEAESICWRCPVRELCLAWSLTLPSAGGRLIYGALAWPERQAIRQHAVRAAGSAA